MTAQLTSSYLCCGMFHVLMAETGPHAVLPLNRGRGGSEALMDDQGRPAGTEWRVLKRIGHAEGHDPVPVKSLTEPPCSFTAAAINS